VRILNDDIQEQGLDDVSLDFHLTSTDPNFDDKVPVLLVLATDDDEADIKFKVFDGSSAASSPADSVVLNAVEGEEKSFDVKLYSQPNSTVEIKFDVSPAPVVRHSVRRPQPVVCCELECGDESKWEQTCTITFGADPSDWRTDKRVRFKAPKSDIFFPAEYFKVTIATTTSDAYYSQIDPSGSALVGIDLSSRYWSIKVSSRNLVRPKIESAPVAGGSGKIVESDDPTDFVNITVTLQSKPAVETTVWAELETQLFPFLLATNDDKIDSAAREMAVFASGQPALPRCNVGHSSNSSNTDEAGACRAGPVVLKFDENNWRTGLMLTLWAFEDTKAGKERDQDALQLRFTPAAGDSAFVEPALQTMTVQNEASGIQQVVQVAVLGGFGLATFSFAAQQVFINTLAKVVTAGGRATADADIIIQNVRDVAGGGRGRRLSSSGSKFNIEIQYVVLAKNPDDAAQLRTIVDNALTTPGNVLATAMRLAFLNAAMDEQTNKTPTSGTKYGGFSDLDFSSIVGGAGGAAGGVGDFTNISAPDVSFKNAQVEARKPGPGQIERVSIGRHNDSHIVLSWNKNLAAQRYYPELVRQCVEWDLGNFKSSPPADWRSVAAPEMWPWVLLPVKNARGGASANPSLSCTAATPVSGVATLEYTDETAVIVPAVDLAMYELTVKGQDKDLVYGPSTTGADPFMVVPPLRRPVVAVRGTRRPEPSPLVDLSWVLPYNVSDDSPVAEFKVEHRAVRAARSALGSNSSNLNWVAWDEYVHQMNDIVYLPQTSRTRDLVCEYVEYHSYEEESSQSAQPVQPSPPYYTARDRIQGGPALRCKVPLVLQNLTNVYQFRVRAFPVIRSRADAADLNSPRPSPSPEGAWSEAVAERCTANRFFNASKSAGEAKCGPCMKGAVCIQDKSTALAGWQRVGGPKHDPVFLECLASTQSCLGAPPFLGASVPANYWDRVAGGNHSSRCNEALGYKATCNDSGLVAQKRGGGTEEVCRLCAKCVEGNYSLSMDGRVCRKCPEESLNNSIIGAGLVGAIIGIYVLFRLTSEFAGKAMSKSDGMKLVLLDSLQMTSLAASMNLHWPQAILNMFGVQNSVGSVAAHLVDLECAFPWIQQDSFLRTRIITGILPAVLIVCIAAFWGTVYALKVCKNAYSHREVDRQSMRSPNMRSTQRQQAPGEAPGESPRAGGRGSASADSFSNMEQGGRGSNSGNIATRNNPMHGGRALARMTSSQREDQQAWEASVIEMFTKLSADTKKLRAASEFENSGDGDRWKSVPNCCLPHADTRKRVILAQSQRGVGKEMLRRWLVKHHKMKVDRLEADIILARYDPNVAGLVDSDNFLKLASRLRKLRGELDSGSSIAEMLLNVCCCNPRKSGDMEDHDPDHEAEKTRRVPSRTPQMVLRTGQPQSTSTCLGVGGSFLKFGKAVLEVVTTKGKPIDVSQLLYNHSDWDRMMLTIVMVLFLLYPTVTKSAMQFFSCVSVNEGSGAAGGAMTDGAVATYLYYDPQQKCWDLRHQEMLLTVGMPMMIVWVVGFPVGVVSMIIHAWRHGKLNGFRTRYKFGQLNSGFRAERWYWFAVVMLRKVVFIFFMEMLKPNPPLEQVYSGIIILVVFLVVGTLARPHNEQVAINADPWLTLGKLDLLGIATPLLTLILGLSFEFDALAGRTPVDLVRRGNESNWGLSAALSTVSYTRTEGTFAAATCILLINCAFYITAIYLFLKQFFAEKFEGGKNAKKLCSSAFPRCWRNGRCCCCGWVEDDHGRRSGRNNNGARAEMVELVGGRLGSHAEGKGESKTTGKPNHIGDAAQQSSIRVVNPSFNRSSFAFASRSSSAASQPGAPPVNRVQAAPSATFAPIAEGGGDKDEHINL
jgi:hypothetical protein